MGSLRLVGVLEWSFRTRLYMCRGGIRRRRSRVNAVGNRCFPTFVTMDNTEVKTADEKLRHARWKSLPTQNNGDYPSGYGYWFII